MKIPTWQVWHFDDLAPKNEIIHLNRGFVYNLCDHMIDCVAQPVGLLSGDVTASSDLN